MEIYNNFSEHFSSFWRPGIESQLRLVYFRFLLCVLPQMGRPRTKRSSVKQCSVARASEQFPASPSVEKMPNRRWKMHTHEEAQQAAPAGGGEKPPSQGATLIAGVCSCLSVRASPFFFCFSAKQHRLTRSHIHTHASINPRTLHRINTCERPS
jgi:hypothetical protein